MQILLDECLPKDFKKVLLPHGVSTVTEKGWSGISNGNLLDLTQKNAFNVFITVDQNLSAQNPKSGTQLIIVILRCHSNRLADLQPFASKILDLLSKSPAAGVYFLEP